MAFSTHDIVSDSPTNNFATLNPLDVYGATIPTLQNGNLEAVFPNAGRTTRGSIAVESGKWYFEYTATNVGGIYNTIQQIGIAAPNVLNDSASAWLFSVYDGNKINNNTSTSYGTGSGSGTVGIIGIAFDLDSGKVWWSRDGIWQASGDPAAGTNAAFTNVTGSVLPFLQGGGGGYSGTATFNFGQDPTFGGSKSPTTTYTDANGIGSFYYQPPTGALALCTANLPDFTPDVDDDVPQDYFKAVTYTGNGTSQSITGVGFQPDLVWSKPRSSGFNIVRDSVRGSTYRLITDNTYAELSGSNYGTFSSNGFNLGSEGNVNSNNVNYIAWCWKSGGPPDLTSSPTKPFAKNGVQYETLSAANITAGTITPTAMSVNTDAGFSIVKYVGVFANRTIPHGLNSVPEMIIVKNLDDSRDWVVYQHEMSSDPKTDHLHLNLTEAVDDYPFWNDTAPTSTFFSIGAYSAVNRDGDSIIAYCWHSVEGYSKFGSYTGNGSTDGPFVYCGFRPAFVMIKCSSDTTTTHTSWAMYDNARDSSNVMNKVLYANKSINEGYRGDASTAATDIYIDFLSNGFKVRSTKEEVNDDGETYIFMAFAEQPFKYANAR